MKISLRFGIPLLLLLAFDAHSERPYVALRASGTGLLPLIGLKPGMGLGGTGTIQIGGIDGVGLLLTSGYTHYSKKDSVPVYNQIPVLAGLKLGGMDFPMYVVTEMGLIVNQSTQTSEDFGWDAGLGAELGPFDLRLSFVDTQVLNQKDIMSIGLSLGFRLWDNQ